LVDKDTRQSRDYLLQRTGRLSQIGGISHFVHAEGKAKGVSTLRVRTASGLEFWVLPDRGMDISEASFESRSLSWHSPTGITHPSYYSNRGTEWLKTFGGGLLCTCGLSTTGSPCEDRGESLGLHGSISNTPAEHVSWSEAWEGDDCMLTVSGIVREVSANGTNLVLERTVSTSLHASSLTLHDVVENQGFGDSPLMILYHFNFGFPLLTERSALHCPSLHIEPRNEAASRKLEEWALFEVPEQGAEETVFFHTMQPNPLGRVKLVLVSDRTKPDFGVSLSYDAVGLPELVQWRMPGTNHFALGLEPANCRMLGRAAERERGTLQTIAPGERREFKLEVSVLDGAKEVSAALAEIADGWKGR